MHEFQPTLSNYQREANGSRGTGHCPLRRDPRSTCRDGRCERESTSYAALVCASTGVTIHLRSLDLADKVFFVVIPGPDLIQLSFSFLSPTSSCPQPPIPAMPSQTVMPKKLATIEEYKTFLDQYDTFLLDCDGMDKIKEIFLLQAIGPLL